MGSLEEYRSSESEIARTEDLLGLLPKGRGSVLDIGARDGHFSRLLTQYFSAVTALDLVEPGFVHPGVTTTAGDVTQLEFDDNSFDCVFCAEVLEHVPDLSGACREIVRVARHEIVVGVPFRQDIRLGRTTCSSCGGNNPPWGHVNSFTEERLLSMFPGLTLIAKSFVGTSRDATNVASTFLMDLGGNPWGTYGQEEPCGHCGAELSPPTDRRFWQKLCSAAAHRITTVQSALTRPHGNWIHLAFSKPSHRLLQAALPSCVFLRGMA